MVIAIDFDGTCTTHDFPYIGKDIGAVPVLKKLLAKGHQLILFTMRSDIENPESENKEIHPVGGNYLYDAVKWFLENDIPLHGIQTNPNQHTWTKSPKCYAEMYIDDAALGCPLLSTDYHPKPYANWQEIESMLTKMELI